MLCGMFCLCRGIVCGAPKKGSLSTYDESEKASLQAVIEALSTNLKTFLHLKEGQLIGFAVTRSWNIASGNLGIWPQQTTFGKNN